MNDPTESRLAADLRVAVVLDGLPGITETFLSHHVAALGADVVARYGDGDPLDTASVAKRISCSLRERTGTTPSREA